MSTAIQEDTIEEQLRLDAEAPRVCKSEEPHDCGVRAVWHVITGCTEPDRDWCQRRYALWLEHITVPQPVRLCRGCHRAGHKHRHADWVVIPL